MQAVSDYPLGRSFVPATLVRRVRPLAAQARVLVRPGEYVQPEQMIAEVPFATEMRPLFAGLAGKVHEVLSGREIVLEGVASIIQGIVGIGGSAAGQLTVLPRGESLAVVAIPQGSIILVPHQLPLTLLQRAAASGAVGIIAASASARELEAFARSDLSLVLEGNSQLTAQAPLVVVLTEGFGDTAMNAGTYQRLAERLNQVVLISGATNPARNIRPEILLPLPANTAPTPTPLDSNIASGAGVTVVLGPRRGSRGVVKHVFARQQYFGPGLLAQCISVQFEDGARETLPVYALERTG